MNLLPPALYRRAVKLAAAKDNPRVRACAAGIALLLPGSFFVLPLIWVWRRRLTKGAVAARAEVP